MFEEIISSFFGRIEIVLVIIAVLFFIIPVIVNLFRRLKMENSITTLNKYSIIFNSRMFFRICLISLLVFFFVTGIFLIFVAQTTTKIVLNKVIGFIFGGAFCVISIILITKILKEFVKVINSQYVIVIDELSDKYYYKEWLVSRDSIDHSRWQLYFKDYFKKYNKYIGIKDSAKGIDYNIGDKFYLVFIKGNNYPYIFPLKKFILADSEKVKLKSLDEAKDFIKLKEFVSENINLKEKIIINKERIKKDFANQGHLRTAIIEIIISIFLVGFMLMSIFCFKNLIATIVITSMMTLFVFLTVVKLKYVIEINRNINNGNIKVKQDEVISLNNSIEYRDSNEMISFKFKDYQKIVFANKDEYSDAKIGDEFYLIFIKGEKEPIKVYNLKNSILDSNLNNIN